MKLKNNKGVTGVDVAIAVVILTIFVSVIATLFYNTGSTSKKVERKSVATNLAIEVIEEMKVIGATDFNNLTPEMDIDDLTNITLPNNGYNVKIGIEDYRDENIVKILRVTVEYPDGKNMEEVHIETLVKNGEVAGGSGGTTWTQGEKDADGDIPITNGKITVEIGDTIDYNSNDNGEQTYTSKATDTGYSTDQIFSSKYEGTWKVIGVSDEGQILIAPTDVIKTTSDGYYYLKGQDGYANAVSELDNISEIFGHGYGAVGARSITVEDVNKVTGYNPNNVGQYDPNQTGNETKYGANELYEYGNEVTYYWDGTEYPYYTYKKSDGTAGTPGNLTSSHSTAFYWFDSITGTWNSYPKATISPTATDISGMEKITTLRSNYYYYYPQTLTYTSNTNATEGLTTGSKAYNAIFADSSESASDCYYWLGSPYVYSITNFAGFGVHSVYGGRVYNCSYLYVSCSSTGIDNHGVRPAVILKSDIQLTGNSEDGWTIVKN